jgi:hypothetical protein
MSIGQGRQCLTIPGCGGGSSSSSSSSSSSKGLELVCNINEKCNLDTSKEAV